jgi:hypothetical protein
MKQLISNPLYRTYFVNNGIIYEIKNTTGETTDTHAKIYNEGSSFPYIFYEDKGGITHIFYLDSLITDGDKLEDDGSFKKVCHEFEGEPEKTPFEYFKALCEKQIAEKIADLAPEQGYSYFYNPENNVNRLVFLGVPDYMLQQNYDSIINGSEFRESDGAQVNWVRKENVINFNEETYNQLLEAEVLKRAKDAANKVANRYSKKVDALTLIDM